MLLPAVVCCLLAFLIGGIPFGYVTGRLMLNDDIRRHGSGNIGATNVWRVLGWKCGVIVLLLDACKGLLPTALSEISVRAAGYAPPEWLMVAAGLSAIAGHMFPVWLNFHGGKGVATALGVVLVISPKSSGVSLVAFILVMLASRMVSLSSIVAALAYAGAHLWLRGESAWTLRALPATVFSLVVPALIIWRHRGNIRRILNGTESRFGRSAKPPDPPAAGP
ncbi:MAG: glycerol-3-phosphate 1-O-acyltransferase PlsY [Planctomycetota bacterium]